MPTSYAYPTNIPGPGPGDVAIAERRLLSNVAGFQQVRQIQHDYLATQEVTFIFTDVQAAIFYTWWRDAIKRGGLWFTATWPLPRGWVNAVRRFVDPPQWTYIPGGSWTVTAKTQVRGASLNPGSVDYVASAPIPAPVPVAPPAVADDPIGHIEPDTPPNTPVVDPGNGDPGTGGGGTGGGAGGDPGQPGQGDYYPGGEGGGLYNPTGPISPNPVDPFGHEGGG